MRQRLPDLRRPAHLVSSRARVMWATQYGAVGVLIGLVSIVLLAWGQLHGEWRWIPFVVAAVIMVIGGIIVPQWRFRVHRWEVTDTAVYTQRGWLVQERRIAPISRVQTVDTERGPLAQLFKLSTVTVTTASAKGELRIEGLERAVADQVVHDLTLTTAKYEGDAT